MAVKHYFNMFDLKNENNDICETVYEGIDETQIRSDLVRILAAVDESVSFASVINHFLYLKNLRPNDLKDRSLLDPKHFHKLTNPKTTVKRPEKETLFQLIIGLELDPNESKELLELANYSFNTHDRTDVIMAYCIQNRVYNINLINEILYENGCRCLGYRQLLRQDNSNRLPGEE